ncbi:hypothetical protein [Myroides odoratus]|uniref:hypothetical protein n=1 Tax=Myroides odoratus TaxID=256 RepID=UPI0039AFC165
MIKNSIFILSVFLFLSCTVNKAKRQKVVEVTITKVFLDTINHHEGRPSPSIELEVDFTNSTFGDIDFRFSGKYSEIKNSRLIFMNLTNGTVLFSGGYGTEEVKKDETLSFTTEIGLWDNEGDYFNIPPSFFNRKGHDYSQDTAYLFKQIKKAFDQSIVILYLNSEDLNHLDPTNQANEYLKEDRIIQVKWAKNLQYELYEEKPPLPVVNNINL